MLSLSHFVRRYAPGAQNAPSPTGTKPQVKQMLARPFGPMSKYNTNLIMINPDTRYLTVKRNLSI